jgi:DNA-binding NarL/FixJ family response regulator
MTAGPSDHGAPLRVLVVDDQASVREGLAVLLDLDPEITVAGTAADGQEAVDLVAEVDPDVVLLDLHMPHMDGTATAHHLRENHPGVAVVILTTYVDDEAVLGALQAGARGYLTKDATRAEITEALHSAHRGLSVVDARIQKRLVAAATREAAREQPRPRIPLPDGLTRREGEVLVLIAGGATNAEIAERLVVSSHTVKSHISRVFAKTGARDRSAAIIYARRHGLGPALPDDGPDAVSDQPRPDLRAAGRPHGSG